MESALLLLPMVSAAVVIVCGEEGEDKFLVAYIVKEGQTSKKEIRGELKRRLPFYMIPSYFVFLDRWVSSLTGGCLPRLVGVFLDRYLRRCLPATGTCLVSSLDRQVPV